MDSVEIKRNSVAEELTNSDLIADTKVRMKLLIDTQGKRVLFAEAGKDCVDFLFYILCLPVSTIIRLLGKQEMVGSLANLYESIETLNESYILPNKTKDCLLKPVSPIPVPLLLSLKSAPTTVKNFYICDHCKSYRRSVVSDGPGAICPECKNTMSGNVTYVAPPGVGQEASGVGEGGFVKEVVTYMVMDDLVVKPMSTISSITLLNQFNVKDVFALEEKVVNLGMNEAVKLLKTSLVSKNVLTNVFLYE